jgi:hypothetical protein
MNLSLKFRDRFVGDLSVVGEEFDNLIAELNARIPMDPMTGGFGLGGNSNLRLHDLTFKSGGQVNGDLILNGEFRQLRGPWFLDDARATADIAMLRPPDPTGTINNYSPPGLATAVGMDIEPSGALTLTGIQATHGRQKRLFILRNRDSSNSITLVDASASSSVGNRFDFTGASGGAGGGSSGVQIQRASRDFTKAEIESLGTTPITIVSAQGAGTLIVPVSYTHRTTTTDAYTSAPTLQLRYEGNATNAANSAAPGLTVVATARGYETGLGTQFSSGTFDPRNKAIQVELSSDPTGVGDATMTVDVYYVVTSGMA